MFYIIQKVERFENKEKIVSKSFSIFFQDSIIFKVRQPFKELRMKSEIWSFAA
jgi:hypothetical protein